MCLFTWWDASAESRWGYGGAAHLPVFQGLVFPFSPVGLLQEGNPELVGSC